MYNLTVAICHVALRIRCARTLKDKRQVTQSLIVRLRNLGFSANECGAVDDLKTAHIGFTFAGSSGGSSRGVAKAVDQARRLFIGDFEVLKFDREIFSYGPGDSLGDSDDLSWMIGVEDDVKD